MRRCSAVLVTSVILIACEGQSGGGLLDPGFGPLESRGTPPTLTWTLECVGCQANAVFGRAPDDVYAVGTAAVHHYDGEAWSNVWTYTTGDEPWAEWEGSHPSLRGAWVAPDGHLYSIQWLGEHVLRFDGSSWAPALHVNLTVQEMSATTEYMFVGVEYGELLRFDGQTWDGWLIPPRPPEQWEYIWDAWGSGDNIFALGADVGFEYGSISQLIGTEWKNWFTSSDEEIPWLYGIWGASPTEVFAVGPNGLILRFNGRGWTQMYTATTAGLSAVWGTSGKNVYAVGDGTILHFDGRRWAPVDTGTGHNGGGAIWGTDSGEVFVVNSAGVLHGRPSPAAQ